ncbi:hypothetical protein BKA64DRAFT_115599 [Cadophora sp. MPI-SDFR-AT-0126]|nr:hypothetical protein BKA64DRAFT_115599 [Leotiomycetes sp. MPI-SDFR-AT-0126]
MSVMRRIKSKQSSHLSFPDCLDLYNTKLRQAHNLQKNCLYRDKLESDRFPHTHCLQPRRICKSSFSPARNDFRQIYGGISAIGDTILPEAPSPPSIDQIGAGKNTRFPLGWSLVRHRKSHASQDAKRLQHFAHWSPANPPAYPPIACMALCCSVHNLRYFCMLQVFVFTIHILPIHEPRLAKIHPTIPPDRQSDFFLPLQSQEIEANPESYLLYLGMLYSRGVEGYRQILSLSMG